MKKNILIVPIVSLVAIWYAQAAWLENVPQTLRQPDGTLLNCFATGDEYHNWLHDGAGYTIVQDPATGYYVYALLSSGDLVPSSYVAGRVDRNRCWLLYRGDRSGAR